MFWSDPLFVVPEVGVYSSSADAKYAAEQSLLGDSVRFEQSLLMVKPDAMESVGKIIAAVRSGCCAF